MASYNKVILIGNLTKDPELRYTPQGTAVVNLRLAVNRKFRDRNQEMKEEVCFVTAVVWDKQAETANQYLHKGSPVLVEGRLQSRSWEDNTGAKRSVIEVRAERVQFLSQGPGGANRGGGGAAQGSEGFEPQAQEETTTENTWLEGGEGKQDES